MGILGLTHDENGVALEKLPVTIKVAIGEGPDPGIENSHPRRLDHFVFKRKTLRGQDVVWEPAPVIAQVYGEKPTELGIVFLHDDPKEILRTEYAWWTPAGCRCHGSLVQITNGNGPGYEMQAIRRTRNHPEGEPWPGDYKYIGGPHKGEPLQPCGDGCPDLERGDCRPSGDLYFVLEKYPRLGAVCRLHTSSYRSVRNLSNGLTQVRRFNGGHLAGIKAVLKATPEKIWYYDKSRTRHSSVVHILSLEIAGEDIPALGAIVREPAAPPAQASRGTEPTPGIQYVVRETATERAQEIAEEFYPTDNSAPGGYLDPPNDAIEDEEQRARICELARRLGYREVKTRMLFAQWGTNLAGLVLKLQTELDGQFGELPPEKYFQRGGAELEKGASTRRTTQFE
jgi:recombination directionality factor gp3-like protein